MDDKRHMTCRRLAKPASITTLLRRPIPGSQASLPLPEEGALGSETDRVMFHVKHSDKRLLFCYDLLMNPSNISPGKRL